MAVKWAVANGNWNAGATWNGGSVPVNGDEIYLNGYTINLNVDFNLPNSTISNCANADYNIMSGGVLNPNFRIINVTAKKYEVDNSNLFNSAYYNSIFNGDVEIIGNGTFCYKSGSNMGFSWTLNGNVFASGSGSLFNDSSHSANTITINGNITTSLPTNGSITRTNTTRLRINGNVLWNGVLGANDILINGNYTMSNTSISTTDLSINGDIKVVNGSVVAATLNFGGQNIQYENTNNSFGVLASTINFTNNNANTFVWKDITEPRVNQFIIVTDADMNNRQQYPPENEVKEGTEYVWGEKIGTYTPDYPPESVVLKDYEYGDEDDRKTGTMVQEVNVEVGCVTPEDVRKDVPLVGMGVVGSLVVPSADDVREGVVFDNGTIGTLIVQGGGDRLRIADFGYYTNAQSDTYIVDITEADKPKFASAEERILIEMFPTLDLDNIPEMYFDDLFVKYLKYRLIVEYYRTAGINSTFTPSEPTTEIVNYRNVTCEVWLNSANTYLNAWNKKFGLNKPPQKIRL